MAEDRDLLAKGTVIINYRCLNCGKIIQTESGSRPEKLLKTHLCGYGKNYRRGELEIVGVNIIEKVERVGGDA